MLNLNHQTVNVNRIELLNALERGKIAHKQQFIELRSDYEAAVIKFMIGAARRARKGDFTNLVLNISAPKDHTSQYEDVIEMLSVSVDETIQLDKDAYRAYYKNQWSWSAGLEASSAAYKSILGGKLR